MSAAIPNASGILGKGGDSLTSAGDFNQAIQYGLLGSGLGSLARQRAGEYQRRAIGESAAIRSNSIMNQSFMDAGFDLLGAGLGAGIKSFKSNAPTMGSGEVSAPSIDVGSATAGEQALMNAKYKLHGW
jgi:hypothetical protein